LVKDITPGAEGSNLTWLTSVKGRLYFVKNDTLWTSDGTAKGTTKVDDKNLAGVTQIRYLTAAGDKLYFTGYTYAAGYELYAGTTKCFAAAKIMAGASISAVRSDAFGAKLLTNPVQDAIKFTVNVDKQQPVQVIVTDASGRVLITDKQTLSPGSNLFSYTIKEWMHGTYIVRIVTASGASSLRAIK